MRRIIDICPVIQAGIRSLSTEEGLLIKSGRVKTFFYDEAGINDSAREQIINSLTRDVYISIDVDVFDPSVMTAVGTPEPGGMRWQEMLDLLRLVCRNRNIVGCDIVELCPPQGTSSCCFTAAKLAYKLIGYALLTGQ
jgi:agmatinase